MSATSIYALFSDNKSPTGGKWWLRATCVAVDAYICLALLAFLFIWVMDVTGVYKLEGMSQTMRVLTAGAGARHMTVLSSPGHTPEPYYTAANPTYEEAYARRVAAEAAASPKIAAQRVAGSVGVAEVEGMYSPVGSGVSRAHMTDEDLLASSM